MSDDLDSKQLHWQCRRGMLELDDLLMNFLDNNYHQLNHSMQQDFANLLWYPDPELFDWLLGKSSPENSRLCAIVSLIKIKYGAAINSITS